MFFSQDSWTSCQLQMSLNLVSGQSMPFSVAFRSLLMPQRPSNAVSVAFSSSERGGFRGSGALLFLRPKVSLALHKKSVLGRFFVQFTPKTAVWFVTVSGGPRRLMVAVRWADAALRADLGIQCRQRRRPSRRRGRPASPRVSACGLGMSHDGASD